MAKARGRPRPTLAVSSDMAYIREKLANILSKVRDLIEAKRVPVRVVASVYGMLAECRLAYGPISALSGNVAL